MENLLNYLDWLRGDLQSKETLGLILIFAVVLFAYAWDNGDRRK